MAAMPDISITLKGAETLTSALADLGHRGAENAARAAIRATVKIATVAIKANTPVYTGILKDAWKTKIVSGLQIKGYVFVDNKMRTPKNKMLRWVMKGVEWNQPLMWRFIKPKNPYLYAARVNESSKTNAGFFDDAVKGVADVMDREFFTNLRNEILKRRLTATN